MTSKHSPIDDWRQRLTLRRRTLAQCTVFIWAFMLTLPARTSAQDQTVDSGTVIGRGQMEQKEGKPSIHARVHEVSIPPADVGMVVELRTLNRQLDLDMQLFVANPDIESTNPVCFTESTGDVERCRILATSLPQDSRRFWIRISRSAGSGTSPYEIRGFGVQGPVLGSSNVTAEDAVSLSVGETHTDGFAQPGDRREFAAAHAYRVDLGPAGNVGALTVSLTSGAENARFNLALYDASGREIRRSERGGPLQEQRLEPGITGQVFITIWLDSLADVRLRPHYTLAVLDPSARATLEFSPQVPILLSGNGAREYTLNIPTQQMAIVTLEGVSSDVEIARASGTPVPIETIFGGEQHIAWIGDPVRGSPLLVTGLGETDAVHLTIRPRTTPADYGGASDWTLSVTAPRVQRRYLMRMRYQNVESWSDWWTGPTGQRKGWIPQDSLRILRLDSPPEANPGRVIQRFTTGRNAAFARLATGSEKFDLAVATRTGEVLSIGDVTVRWDWPPDASELYLVVFPAPQSGPSIGGQFTVELSRSFAASNWKE